MTVAGSGATDGTTAANGDVNDVTSDDGAGQQVGMNLVAVVQVQSEPWLKNIKIL